MAACPKCKAPVSTWTLLRQTNFSKFSCVECGARLRMHRGYLSGIGALGGATLLISRLLYAIGPAYAWTAVVASIALALYLTIAAPAVEDDGKDSRSRGL